MSDVLKNPASDQLSFVGFMPENLPFKINKCPKEKNNNSEKYAHKEWYWEFPDPVVCSQRSNKNNQQ